MQVQDISRAPARIVTLVFKYTHSNLVHPSSRAMESSGSNPCPEAGARPSTETEFPPEQLTPTRLLSKRRITGPSEVAKGEDAGEGEDAMRDRRRERCRDCARATLFGASAASAAPLPRMRAELDLVRRGEPWVAPAMAVQ